MDLRHPLVQRVLREVLQEDLGEGDVTTDTIIPDDAPFCRARIAANSSGILAGCGIAQEVFRLLSPDVKFTGICPDGTAFSNGMSILEIAAPPAPILKGERLALNFLQRLSGIATLTHSFVECASRHGVKILDTRKTTPGLRIFEKYAVKVGGGYNHRFDLSGGILIKENHIRAVGNVHVTIERAQKNPSPYSRIEVEVTTLEEVQQVSTLPIDIIMLDNFDLEGIREAISLVRNASSHMLIEVSGGITLDNLEDIARLHPDFISVGKLTHSAPSVDMSLTVA